MSAVVQLFFNGAGRIGRASFLGAAGALLGLLALADFALPPAVHRWTGWAFDLLLLFAACAVTGKRLHDRGRSGWWTALVLLAFLNVWPTPRGLGWLFVPVLVLCAIELAVLPGQPRFNRFGPPPAPPLRRG